MYGLVDDEAMNQPLGSLLCEPGRCVCFPNIIQHQVAPFRLADASRPGVRKIVAVFLVDPNVRVLSTRDVPPQQQSWHDAASGIGSLVPEEVKRKLDAMRDFPISHAAALAFREELMQERMAIQERDDWEYFERPFSLCEH
jgi:Protein of unknown function (DUF4246)